MTVAPNAHQHDIEQWPDGIERVSAVERFQLAFVAPCGLLGIASVGRNRMNVGSWRAAIQKDSPRRAHVVERIVGRDKTFIADEPMRAVPRDLASIGIGPE